MTKPCGHSDCAVSTGIHEGLTFGRGDLDHHGYWEISCSLCARAHEAHSPEDGPCWPFKERTVLRQGVCHRWTARVVGHLMAQYTGDVLPRGDKKVAVYTYTCVACGEERDTPPPPLWDQTVCPRTVTTKS